MQSSGIIRPTAAPEKLALKGCPKRIINVVNDQLQRVRVRSRIPIFSGGTQRQWRDSRGPIFHALRDGQVMRVCKVRHLKKRTISWTDEQESLPSRPCPRKLPANVECSCWSSPRLHLTSVTGNTMQGRWRRWAANLGAFR